MEIVPSRQLMELAQAGPELHGCVHPVSELRLVFVAEFVRISQMVPGTRQWSHLRAQPSPNSSETSTVHFLRLLQWW